MQITNWHKAVVLSRAEPIEAELLDILWDEDQRHDVIIIRESTKGRVLRIELTVEERERLVNKLL